MDVGQGRRLHVLSGSDCSAPGYSFFVDRI